MSYLKRTLLLSFILSIPITVNSQDILTNILDARIQNWIDESFPKGLDEFINQPDRLIRFQFSELIGCEVDFYQNAFTVMYQGRVSSKKDNVDIAFYDVMCLQSGDGWRIVLHEKPEKAAIPHYCGLTELTEQVPCYTQFPIERLQCSFDNPDDESC